MKALSHRESQALKLIAQGFTAQEIADVMKLGVKTAETYRLRVCRKLDLKSRAQLFRYAFDAGMLTADQLVAKVPTPIARKNARVVNDD